MEKRAFMFNMILSELEDMGKVGPGSRVLMVGFGGGLTWAGAMLTV